MRNLRTNHTPIASGILWLTGIQMASSALTVVLWRLTANDSWIDLFFKYQGCLFFIVCAALEAYLAWSAFRQFSPGEPMRAAWLLIAIGSLYRLTGFIFTQTLSVESYLNPLFLVFGSLDASVSSTCRRFGLLVSGPLHMALLAAGLFLILRILRRLGILSRLRLPDRFLLAGVAAFGVRQLYEFSVWLRSAPAPYDFYKLLSWAIDPFLCVLLFEAVLIWRSAADTGWGLLARSWRAFAAGIFLTSLGNMGLWATAQSYLPWPYSSITWYVWFLASAAYALGPAYQVEAYRRTLREAAAITNNRR